jgi:hypothetical protein
LHPCVISCLLAIVCLIAQFIALDHVIVGIVPSPIHTFVRFSSFIISLSEVIDVETASAHPKIDIVEFSLILNLKP